MSCWQPAYHYSCSVVFKFSFWDSRPVHIVNCPWSASESLQWIGLYPTYPTKLRPSVLITWCQVQYQSPAVFHKAPCWTLYSSFCIWMMSRGSLTNIKLAIVFMVTTNRHVSIPVNNVSLYQRHQLIMHITQIPAQRCQNRTNMVWLLSYAAKTDSELTLHTGTMVKSGKICLRSQRSLDSEPTMKTHISKVVRSCWHQLHRICQICRLELHRMLLNCSF